MGSASIPNFAYPIANVIVPTGGPKCVPTPLDFSATGQIDIDGQGIIDTHGIEYIQGVYIDNFDNADTLTLTVNGTGHRIIAKAGSQGFYNLLVQNPPKFTAKSAQLLNKLITVTFYNVPIMPCVWP